MMEPKRNQRGSFSFAGLKSVTDSEQTEQSHEQLNYYVILKSEK